MTILVLPLICEPKDNEDKLIVVRRWSKWIRYCMCLAGAYVWLVHMCIYVQRIVICPHGYHHDGFKATPALNIYADTMLLFVDATSLLSFLQLLVHMFATRSRGRFGKRTL